MAVAVAEATSSVAGPSPAHRDGHEASGKPTPAPAKPDADHYNNLIKAEQNRIDELRREIAKLTDQINECSSANKGFEGERAEIMAEVQALNGQIESLEAERERIMEQVSQSQNKQRNLRQQMDNMQRNMSYKTVEAIDRRIAELEMERMTAAINLKQERAILVEIEKLKQMKPELSKLAILQQQATQLSGASVSVRENDRLTQVRDELRSLREKRSDAYEKLAALSRKRDENMAPIRETLVKRDELRQKLGEHNTKKGDIQAELQSKELEYYAYTAKLKQQRAEIERYERQLRQVDADKKALQRQVTSLPDSAHNWKVSLALQLRSYLEELQERYNAFLKQQEQQQQATEETEETAKATDETEEFIENELGKFRLYKRDGEEVLKVGNRKQQKKKKATSHPHTSFNPSVGRKVPVTSSNLQHNMTTIREFHQVGLEEIPTRVEEIPSTLEALEKIVSAETSKSDLLVAVAEERRQELEKRIDALNAKEAQLLANPPPGYKKPKKSEPATED